MLACLSMGVASTCAGQTDREKKEPKQSTVSVHELPLTDKPGRDFDKGTQLLLKGDLEGSVKYFLKVVEEAPYSYRPYHNLAIAYFNLGQLEAAAENFQKSIDLTSKRFAPSIFGAAMVFYRQHNYSRAEALIQEGLLLQPGSGVGRYCMGLIHFSLGRIAEAEESAREALALDAGETDAYVLLARVHERQHKPADQLKDAQTYLKLEPQGVQRTVAQDLERRAKQALAMASNARN